jgi:protocatechuate 3,4-dioxygenase beta subunit
MIARLAVAVGLALCVGRAEMAGAQVRDAASVAPTGTGAIAGTIVTDDVAPQPVRHAIVTLNSQDRLVGRAAISDDQGRFAFVSLPQGRYSLSGQKQGWVAGAYGAKAVGRPGRTLPLASGERVTATIRIARGAVISGTILDQFGQPVAGATVHAMKNGYELTTGQHLLSPTGVSDSPDEHGAYRLYGLAPGDYYVSVTNATLSSDGGRDLHLTSEVDVQDALKTSSQPVTAPAADVPQPTVGFAQVFYPGATSVPQAIPITVKAGEERTGVDFNVTYTSVTHVSGTVTSPLSEPIPAVVFLTDPASRFAGAQRVAHVMTGPDGRFRLSDIVPGLYVMTAHDMRPASAEEHLGTSSDLDVPADGLTGLTIALQDALTVSGMLKYEGASPGPGLSSLQVQLSRDDAGVFTRSGGGPTTTVDGRFTLHGVLPGRYRVFINLPGPPTRWRLSSATILGQEALDNAAEVRQSVTDAVITITDQLSTLTGKLESPGAAADYTLILFATDPGLWRPLSRRILTSRVAGDGTYSFANVPPGDYWLAAVDDVEPGEWFDSSFLQRIQPAAIKVTISEGEKKTQDLRVGGGELQ